MELYAAGFNAHGQITNSSPEDTVSTSHDTADVPTFRLLASSHNFIRVLYACWSETILLPHNTTIVRLGVGGPPLPTTSNTITTSSNSTSFVNGHSSESSWLSEPFTHQDVAIEDLRLASFFGTHDGVAGAVLESGEVCFVRSSAVANGSSQGRQVDGDVSAIALVKSFSGGSGASVWPPRVSRVAITAAGRVAVSLRRGGSGGEEEEEEEGGGSLYDGFAVLEFGSLDGFREWCASPPDSMQTGDISDTTASPGLKESSTPLQLSLPCLDLAPGGSRPEIQQLVAGTSGFTALTTAGQVFTWGDARYGKCLGRACSDNHTGKTSQNSDSTTDTNRQKRNKSKLHKDGGRKEKGGDEAIPANQLGLVDALVGLCITHIAQQGWTTGALSNQGDLYLWGMPDPQEGRVVRALAEADERGEMAGLVDLPGGRDVESFDIGGGHIAVVASGGDDAMSDVETGKNQRGENGQRCFVTGRNGNGELGIGKARSGEKFVDEWIEAGGELAGREVVSIWCGAHTTFVLVKK